MTQTIFAIGGLSSEVGKTTLMCDLLGAFPGWEAIKVTRGHYRSCGKSAHACCVSHLLSDAPVICSGREQTYAVGKDTGRYWDAGAVNVHWLIVTDRQVEQGIKLALERVRAPGVFIEGNSFLQFIDVDYTIMVARGAGHAPVKASARRALAKTDALYMFDQTHQGSGAGDEFSVLRGKLNAGGLREDVPLYTGARLSPLIAHLRTLHDAHLGLRIK